MYIGLHVMYPCSGQILMQIEFSYRIFEKNQNNELNENSLMTHRAYCHTCYTIQLMHYSCLF